MVPSLKTKHPALSGVIHVPAGWYIDDKDYTTFSIANDPEAVKCLKAPLKKGGYNFEERKAFWDSFFNFKTPKLRLPVKIAKTR